MPKKKLLKHWVRLCRPRFDTVVIEIKAKDEDDAEVRALDHFLVGGIPEDDWRPQPFDQEFYTAHVERICSDTDVEKWAEGDAAERASYLAELNAVEQDKYTRYLLLHADVGGGSGKVLWQPWFPEAAPELLEHDLATDWVTELEEIGDDGLENFEAEFTPKPDISVPDNQRAIILNFPTGEPAFDQEERPDPRQYHSELPELLARPLTKTEHDAVLDCLVAIDTILAKPQTVAMRAELAAALAAHACGAAYSSAIEMGEPHEAEQRFAAFERLIGLRARELFAQKRG